MRGPPDPMMLRTRAGALLGEFRVRPFARLLEEDPRARPSHLRLRRQQDAAFAAAMAGVAQELAAQGRHADAADELTRALELHESVHALALRANSHLALRRFDHCTADFNRALALDPANGSALAYFDSLRPGRRTRESLGQGQAQGDEEQLRGRVYRENRSTKRGRSESGAH